MQIIPLTILVFTFCFTKVCLQLFACLVTQKVPQSKQLNMFVCSFLKSIFG